MAILICQGILEIAEPTSDHRGGYSAPNPREQITRTSESLGSKAEIHLKYTLKGKYIQ
jgi:hypothetical protein